MRPRVPATPADVADSARGSLESRLFKLSNPKCRFGLPRARRTPAIRGSTIWDHLSPLAQEGSEPPPEYVAEATEPSEEAWAQEQELYREKDEGQSEPSSGC